MIRVQREDFDVGAELEALTAGNHAIGGVATFVGLVRDLAAGETVSAMTLEHYPGMTEKMLEKIEAEAKARWPSGGEPDHSPPRPPGTRRPDCIGDHRQPASGGGFRVLSVPHGLAEDPGTFLEKGRHQGWAALGRGARER